MAYDENYNTRPVVGYEGQVADMSTALIVSRTVEAEIGFGKAVARGSEAHKVRAIAAGDTTVYGFTVRNQATPAENANVYPANDTGGIMLKGPMWVKVAETVAAGDAVSVVVATGAIGKATGAGIVVVEGATFETAAASGELAKILII